MNNQEIFRLWLSLLQASKTYSNRESWKDKYNCGKKPSLRTMYGIYAEMGPLYNGDESKKELL